MIQSIVQISIVVRDYDEATDDFYRAYNEMLSNGVEFVRKPQNQDYGTIAVFKDSYGNLWGLSFI